MNKSILPDQKVSKKEARLLIYIKLADALSEYNNGKKFEEKLKKASKLFATEVVKESKGNKGGVRKLHKKATKNKTDAKQVKEALT